MDHQKPILEWVKSYPERGNIIWFGKYCHVSIFGVGFVSGGKQETNPDGTQYELKCFLPGVPKDLGFSQGSFDELKDLAENRFETWLNATGLTKR